MRVSKLQDHLYLIDLETGGFRNFVSSYLLKGDKAIVVETGPRSSVENLLNGLKEIGVETENVSYVAVSHVHLDHAGGVGTLVKNLPNARVIVHPRGAAHLIDPEKLWDQSQQVMGKITDLYGKPEPVDPQRIVDSRDGMNFDVGNGVKLQVVETLGHASHHQSYRDLLGGGIFPGDAAGIYLKEFDTVVPTIPAPFLLDKALFSLDKLIALKPAALYYSHFGAASDPLAKLEGYERQLTLWVKTAREGLAAKHDLEEIRTMILEKDVISRKAIEFISSHPVLNETVLNNSVQGAVWFAEKYPSP